MNISVDVLLFNGTPCLWKKNIDLKEDSYVDESESETENEFIVTESGVMKNDGNHELIEMSIIKSTLEENEEEEEENVIEFDQSKEVGSVHYSYPWISRLWASLALSDIQSIIKSINSICNRLPITRRHKLGKQIRL